MVNGLSQLLSGIIKEVPPAVWGTLAGAILSLSGVMLSLRHARKLQAIQLAHDAKERDRERQMAWRREVYLHAAESISRLHSVLGRIADIGIPDQDLTRTYQDDVAKITRIQVIANEKTIAAVNAFTGAYATSYLKLFVDRAMLLAQRNEIESLGAILQRSTEAKERYEALQLQMIAAQNPEPGLRAAIATEVEVHRKKAEYCTQRRLELMEQLPRDQQALLKATMEAGFTLAPFITPALFAVREELEMPLNTEDYLQQSNEIMKGLRIAVDTSMTRVDDVLAGGSRHATDRAEGAGA